MEKLLKLRVLIPAFGALLYGASPIDLIPDLIPVLGLVDDAFIVPLLLLVAFLQSRKIRARRSPTGAPEYLPPTRVR